jgi:DHA2 family multidrug resistance protein-like MFS transporter
MNRTGQAVQPKAGMRAWLGFGALALPALLVSVDVSVMILALPHIGTDLDANSVEQLWIMDIYGFMLSGFLITMGAWGDRIGRRKLLMLGSAGFCAASLAAAFARSPEMLIASRALMGISGATVAPSSMALIRNMFHDHKERSLAFGIWMACTMGGMALGPVAGGLLLEHFGWSAIFLMGVPIMALLLITAPVLLPEFRAPDTARPDSASIVLSLTAILSAIYGLKELAAGGSHPVPFLAALAGAFLAAIFLHRQRRLRDPLVDLRLFHNASFSTALGGMFGITLTGAIMLSIAQYLQLVQGFSPFRAALWMLPSVIASMAGMLLSPLIARRLRPAYLIAGGLIISGAGCLMLLEAGVETGFAALVAGYVLFNLGTSPLVSLSGDLAVGSAPRDRAGAAAAMLQTSGEFAFALGIAVLGSLGSFAYRRSVAASVPADQPDSGILLAADNPAGFISEAENRSGGVSLDLMDVAYRAFASGMHAVALASGVILFGVALLIAMKLRRLPPVGTAGPDGAGHP